MKLLYLIFIALNTQVEKSFCDQIIDINLPKNHLSKYFNNLRIFTKDFNETATGFYKEFLSSEEYDPDTCWGYEYECKNPHFVHRCPGDFKGYVKTKEIQLDVFHTEADFGN